MGDIMYTVDRIEENIIIIENRDSNEIKEVDINLFDYNVKEGDIVELVNDKYVINNELTNNVKKDIRSRFDRLKK